MGIRERLQAIETGKFPVKAKIENNKVEEKKVNEPFTPTKEYVDELIRKQNEMVERMKNLVFFT